VLSVALRNTPLVPLAPMFCFVDNLDDWEEKKQSFGSFGEGMLHTVLRVVVANGQKRAVDFIGARSNLIKMHLSLIHTSFFFVTHTSNGLGKTSQLKTLDQNKQNC